MIASATVPDVRGKPLEEANAAIEAAGLTPDDDPILCRLCSFDEAVRTIKGARGKALYLHADQRAVYKAEDGTLPWHYEMRANVRVTKRAAIDYLNDALTPAFRDRVLIGVWESKHCLWVGQTPAP